jgi:hypothetical protein
MGGEKFYREGSVEELAPAVVPAETYSLVYGKEVLYDYSESKPNHSSFKIFLIS